MTIQTMTIRRGAGVKWWWQMDPLARAMLVSILLWFVIIGVLWMGAKWVLSWW